MDRVFSAVVSASPPEPPTDPAIGYPTRGNPAVGAESTKPGAYWYYMMTEELRAVLVAGGVTPSHTNVTQLLQALRSAGVFTTPAQFDSGTKAATTEFVQRALGNDAGYVFVGVTTSLLPSNAGKLHGISSGGITLTLPSAGSVPPGSKFVLHGMQGSGSSASTITRAGTDTIITNGSLSLTALSLRGGDTAVLESLGVGNWLLAGGTEGVKYSSPFASNLALNGYKRYPDANSPTGSVIEQWGSFQLTAANTWQTFAYPIAFPNQVYSIVGSSASAGSYGGAQSNSLSSMNLFASNSGAVISFRAAGY